MRMQGYYPCTVPSRMYEIVTHIQTHTDKMPAGVVLRTQDEIVDLSLMQVSLGALTCRGHLTGTCGGSRHGSSTGSWEETLTYRTGQTGMEDLTARFQQGHPVLLLTAGRAAKEPFLPL